MLFHLAILLGPKDVFFMAAARVPLPAHNSRCSVSSFWSVRWRYLPRYRCFCRLPVSVYSCPISFAFVLMLSVLAHMRQIKTDGKWKGDRGKDDICNMAVQQRIAIAMAFAVRAREADTDINLRKGGWQNGMLSSTVKCNTFLVCSLLYIEDDLFIREGKIEATTPKTAASLSQPSDANVNKYYTRFALCALFSILFRNRIHNECHCFVWVEYLRLWNESEVKRCDALRRWRYWSPWMRSALVGLERCVPKAKE